MREHLSAASAKLAVRALTSLCGIALLLGAACGGATTTGSPTQSAGTFPVTIDQSGNVVTLTKKPARIVSLSPTATEMLFAIGAGKQVVAVDDQSNYPTSAPMTRLSGFEPNVEAIAGYTPDLVVASDDTGGLVAGLGALKVPVLLEPAARDLNGSYGQLRELGKATGHGSEADSVVAKMKSDIASITGSLKKPARPLTVYHELDQTYFSATSHTFIGQVYTLLGLRDIADQAASAGNDYPQLSSEYIVSANPDLIVLADTRCCQQTAQTVAARPGWGAIAAVKRSEVVAEDDDVASRWGPRIVDFIRSLAPHVAEAERAAA